MNIYANVQDQKVLPNKVGNALGQRCNIDLCRQRIVLVLRAGEILEYAEDEWQLHLQQSSGYVDGNDSLSRILAKNITLRSGTRRSKTPSEQTHSTQSLGAEPDTSSLQSWYAEVRKSAAFVVRIPNAILGEFRA